MSRLHVVHRTVFAYSAPVSASYNEARMRPATLAGQTVLESRLSIVPSTWSTEYRDYWGTLVTAFEVLEPHDRLLITAESRVDVAADRRPGATATWEALHTPAVVDRHVEFLAHTPSTEPPDEIEDLARAVLDPRHVDATARAVCDVVRSRMEYMPGVTGTHTRAAEAWAEGRGVCQDIAQLALGALRVVGIPARYVSGYLHPLAGAAIGEAVTGQSHAWVEYWAGDWHGYDPTNGSDVGEHHVIVARGREYGDVAPLRGVFAGGATTELSVAVEITQEA